MTTETQVQLTDLEQQVIDAIKKVDCPTYFFADDIYANMKADMKQVRGAISSLVKKGVLYIDDDPRSKGLISVFNRSFFPDGFFE